LQLTQETFKLLFYSGSEVQRRHFCGTHKRQKIEEHVFTDLDKRNDENRSSLTSGAAAEERQEVSSQNTIDKMADAITRGKHSGLWSSNILQKNAGILVEKRKVIFKILCSTTKKRQKLLTDMHHKSYSSP